MPNGSIERLVKEDRRQLPLQHGDGPSRVLETIVYKDDGSIVAFEGSPGFLGRILSRPRVIQPSVRFLLEMWWPLMASTTITILVLGILRRDIRQSSSDYVL